MTAKTSTTIYLNAELINLAKELGLNISKTCENALKLSINRLQGSNAETKDALQQFGANFIVVDRAGFEPNWVQTTALKDNKNSQQLASSHFFGCCLLRLRQLSYYGVNYR